MPERKTVGQLMEEMRLKAGAQNYHGHEYMDLERFAEDTRHMIIFDVLTNDSPCRKSQLFSISAVKLLRYINLSHLRTRSFPVHPDPFYDIDTFFITCLSLFLPCNKLFYPGISCTGYHTVISFLLFFFITS